MVANTNQGPSPISGRYIAAMVMFGLTFLVHLASVISHAVANDEDYIDDWEDEYYKEYGDYDYIFTDAGWAAIILGTIAIILWIIDTPLAFCAGKKYLSERHVRGAYVNVFAIVSWVIYGLNTIDGVSLILYGIVCGTSDDDCDVPTGWNAVLLVLAVIQFSLMITYVELARRKYEAGPQQVATAQPPYLQHVYPQPLTAGAESAKQETVDKVIEEVRMPDGSWMTKITKTTRHPDGSKTVETTKKPREK